MQEASQFVPMHILTPRQHKNRHCLPCCQFLQTRGTAVWTKATTVVACTAIGSLKEILYMVHLAMYVTTVTLSATAGHRFTTSRYLKHKYTHHIRRDCSSEKKHLHDSVFHDWMLRKYDDRFTVCFARCGRQRTAWRTIGFRPNISLAPLSVVSTTLRKQFRKSHLSIQQHTGQCGKP